MLESQSSPSHHTGMGEPTSEKAGKKHNAVIEDDELERVLNQVDERTQIQQLFHEHLSNGFMSLARERYRDPSSAERKSSTPSSRPCKKLYPS